jgi:imidazolonepropionase-like amidohydrolase
MTSTAFVGATLIDGTGSPPRANSAVVVSGDRIAWVGPTSELDHTRKFKEIDLDGKFLIPGLLDANAHLVVDWEPEVLLRYEPGCYDELVLEAAQVALCAGITTVFDTFGPIQSLRRVRDRINAGDAIGTRIFLAGNIIGNDGPWSDDFIPALGQSMSSSVVDSINWHWSQGVGAELTWMSADAVRHAVREYIASSGIDFVKYSSSSHAHLRFLAFSPDAQRAIVEEAHKAGMTAQACTMGPEALKVAIEAGVDLLQHGNHTGRYLMPTEILDTIVKRQLPCVAFLYTDRYLQAITERKPQWNGTEYGTIQVAKDQNARRLIKAGAKLLLANDMGVFGPTSKTSPFYGAYQDQIPDPPQYLGKSHIFWLKAAVERGMAPMDCLLATTRNIAQAYGMHDELGTIEVGKRADLLVLDGDPLKNVDNYGRIVQIIKDGDLVDRQRLPEHPVLTSSSQATRPRSTDVTV